MRKKKIYIRDGRAPLPRNECISRTMSAIRAKNTKPELLVRAMLREAKVLGYRQHLKNIPGRPDFAFPKKKVAVFVHGCYWHGCRYCKLTLPKTHRAFWKNKMDTNRLRDGRKVRELRRLGWCAVTIWACRIKTDRGSVAVMKRIKDAFS
ncbi:MAG: hypothetical protein A3D92_02105 [Bacteroidetes bacterium RIFCSPHIGHO2_02_FULL_44_7]|nr:MAG: hypothetical protein A3D92_02105 [Bacteroidetes bacterium RIFCSPHIGHO2_02_FULL_44_7]